MDPRTKAVLTHFETTNSKERRFLEEAADSWHHELDVCTERHRSIKGDFVSDFKFPVTLEQMQESNRRPFTKSKISTPAVVSYLKAGLTVQEIKLTFLKAPSRAIRYFPIGEAERLAVYWSGCVGATEEMLEKQINSLSSMPGLVLNENGPPQLPASGKPKTANLYEALINCEKEDKLLTKNYRSKKTWLNENEDAALIRSQIVPCTKKAIALLLLYILRHYRRSNKPIVWSPALRTEILKNHRSKFVKCFAPLCCLLALLNMKVLVDWAKDTKLDLSGETGRQKAVSEIRKKLEDEIEARMRKKTKPPKDFKLISDVFLNFKVKNLKSYTIFGAI